MSRPILITLASLAISAMLVGCGGGGSSKSTGFVPNVPAMNTPHPGPSSSGLGPQPSSTPVPTITPLPTASPIGTMSPAPTPTPL